MKAGFVRLGVTTAPEHAASASASSRMIGPAFSLIRMAWGVQKVRQSSRTILAWANGPGRDIEQADIGWTTNGSSTQAELFLLTLAPAPDLGEREQIKIAI
jgi:hypothetical protein